MKKILISLVLFASVVLADDWETAGGLNGRGWVKMNTTFTKAMYLKGFYDGQDYITAHVAKTASDAEKLKSAIGTNPVGTSLNQIVGILDTFYSDQSNAGVLVAHAFV